jgi:hypothetical protein
VGSQGWAKECVQSCATSCWPDWKDVLRIVQLELDARDASAN